MNRNQPFVTVTTVEQLIADSLGERRLPLALIAAFASIALGLAAIGIYGLLSFTTAQRTGEIRIRMALGASGGQILTLVVCEALQLALAGIALGAVGALARFAALRHQPPGFGGARAGRPRDARHCGSGGLGSRCPRRPRGSHDRAGQRVN